MARRGKKPLGNSAVPGQKRASKTKRQGIRRPPLHPIPEGELLPAVSSLRRMEERFDSALSNPKVSIVVVNHNGVDSLWHCFFALKTQSYPIHEIILVDNASQDASVSFVRANYPQVKILECQENFGPAMGYDLGAKTAKGDLVVLVQGQVVFTPDWLGLMVKRFQKSWPRFGVVASSFGSKPENRASDPGGYRTLNLLGNPIQGFFEDPQEAFYPELGAVLYPRFLALEGPFDSDYFHFQEDVYWGWKFRSSGYRPGRFPDVKVFQNTQEAAEEDEPEWKSIYYQTRNRWLNLLLFYESENLMKVMPWMIAEALVLLAKSLVTGFSFFWGIASALVWLCAHPGLIRRKRQLIQEKRKVADRDILKCLSGRVVPDRGVFSRVINLVSLAYCRLTGLGILEAAE